MRKFDDPVRELNGRAWDVLGEIFDWEDDCKTKHLPRQIADELASVLADRIDLEAEAQADKRIALSGLGL